MAHNETYTDYQREQIARQQYEAYSVGKKVTIKE